MRVFSSEIEVRRMTKEAGSVRSEQAYQSLSSAWVSILCCAKQRIKVIAFNYPQPPAAAVKDFAVAFDQFYTG